MAKLKATPKNYAEALTVLAGRESVRLGNNTYLMNIDYARITPCIAVRLHSTDIVKFYPDGSVTLHTGGYHTVTTKERINHFITGRVYSRNYQWFYCPLVDGRKAGELAKAFEEGMEVSNA
jgi:hypothetical protein